MLGYALASVERYVMSARNEMAEELKKEMRTNTIPHLTSINESIDRVRDRLNEQSKRRIEDE